MKAVWRPGSDHKVADCLSHHPCGVPTEDDLEGENEVEDACMLMRMAALVDMESGEDILVDRQLLDVQRIGKLDDEYVRLIKTIHDGFPATQSALNQTRWVHIGTSGTI